MCTESVVRTAGFRGFFLTASQIVRPTFLLLQPLSTAILMREFYTTVACDDASCDRSLRMHNLSDSDAEPCDRLQDCI